MIGGNPQAAVMYFGPLGFMGMHKGYGSPIYRRIVIEELAVVITDISPENEISQIVDEKIHFSPAYGIIQNLDKHPG